MERIVYFLVGLVCWVAQASAATNTCPVDEPISDVCISSQKILSSINSFAVDLYKQVAALKETTPTTNMVILPIHAATALLMSCNAARGAAQSEIIAGLKLSGISCLDAFNTILDLYRLTPHKSDDADDKVFDDVTYQVNRAFVNKDVKLKADFMKALSDRFNQTVGVVDFASNPDKARTEINKWVSDKSQGNIKDLLAAKDVSKTTQITIVNAHYLKFNWNLEFDKNATAKGNFTNADGTKSQVDMMHLNGHTIYYFGSLDGKLKGVPPFHMVKLYSKWMNGEMLVFLPKDSNGLAALEKGLSTDIINQAISGISRKAVDVTLPKFATTSQSDLQAALKGLGIQHLFDKSVDLSPMTDTPVTVTNLVHKAMINVHEEGLQAAAGSAFSIQRGLDSGVARIPFVADHPFLFALRLEQTDRKSVV